MEAKKLINVLSKKHLTIGSVESLTGGLFIASLASVPGASKVVRGGLVTYQSNFKTSLLGIKKSDIDKYGVVSEKIATLMVKKAFPILKTDVIISFTGNAGPSKEKGKAEVGRVYIALLIKGKKVVNYSKLYKGDRNTIRKKVTEDALLLIYEEIEALSNKCVK